MKPVRSVSKLAFLALFCSTLVLGNPTEEKASDSPSELEDVPTFGGSLSEVPEPKVKKAPKERPIPVASVETTPEPLPATTPSPAPVPSPTPTPTPTSSPSTLPATAREDSEVDLLQKDPFPFTKEKPYSVQVGAYSNLRKAAVVKALLQNVSSAWVEKIHGNQEQPLYRVLVGTFSTIKKAQEFVHSHRLNDLFKDVWANAVAIEAPTEESGAEIVPQDILDRDPYYVHLTLKCSKGKTYGQYKTELQPDPKSRNREIELKVNWNCIPDPYEKWVAKDQKRSPSHLFVAPVFGIGSLGATETTLGTASRFNFAYGAEVGAFKSFGGMGPTIEYRILNQRYSVDAMGASPTFYLNHRGLVGARLPISHRFEFQPLFGFFTDNFYSGTDPTTATFTSPLLTQAAIRMTWHLMELDQRAWLNLTGGFHYLFPTTTPTLTLNWGYEWNVKVQSRTFFLDSGGIDWFIEYSSKTQGTATLQQSSSLVVLGVTALFTFF